MTDYKPIKRASPLVYEEQLGKSWDLTLSEGGRYFENKSAVQEALRKIASRLDDIGVPYAVVGGLALAWHGRRRFTEDVDLLVASDGLERIHAQLKGNGYRPLFEGSKNLRDTDLGVRIEFLVTGEYPGDGKPKPVSFPKPEDAVILGNGIKFVNLETFIDLKLASGMTNINRLRDIADVQDLINDAGLPRDIADRLNPYVRAKYIELWDAAQQA
jgi:hypothetical protein